MKRLKIISIFLWTFCLQQSVYALDTVAKVDLERYLGTWYEIAKYPNRFQKDCLVSKASYTLLKPDVIQVDNQCLESDGKIAKALGKAYIADPTSHAKLKVQFFLTFLNLPWLQGDYWIIDLDDNYQYAIVSEPSQKYLWILARTPHMDENLYQQLLMKLKIQGFDLNRIIKDEWSDELNSKFIS